MSAIMLVSFIAMLNAIMMRVVMVNLIMLNYAECCGGASNFGFFASD
jgi:hypothetical protein